MKFNLAFILSIIIASGLVSFGFTYYQISTERTKLNTELESRVTKVTEELVSHRNVLIDTFNANSLHLFINRSTGSYGLLGIGFYFGDDSFICNDQVVKFKSHSEDYLTQVIAADTAFGIFFSENGSEFFQYVKSINNNGLSSQAIVLYVDAEYIDNLLSGIWFRSFIRWFFQALIVSIITVLIIRYGIFSPINKIVDWVKVARTGNLEELGKKPPAKFLAPLHQEITRIARAMHEAKASAEEEARLRSKSEAIWTPERLKIEMINLLHDRMMVVVSNREPYMHVKAGKEVKWMVPASGMITAIEPILKACGGLWIATANGDADREVVDSENKVKVPPDDPKYVLKRLWLSEEEEKHYYYGFSNEGLWPLCHIAHTRPVFRKNDWDYYQKVNKRFADTVIKETASEEQPLILIQDYHFALLPALIRQYKPNARIALFWHIPWPNPESFGICPWQREILTGMLGADLIGFHTQYHCNHFLETVNNSVESRVQWEDFTVRMGGRKTQIKPFPISIEFTLKDFNNDAKKPDILPFLKEHNITTSRFIGIGVDRLDYTKGIIEKFLAVEMFLEKYPEYQGKFTLIQIGAPSRSLLKTYSDTGESVEREADRINNRFKMKNWKAILLLTKHHSHDEIKPLYAAADFCMITSLHDGMNLVAKEYVAERSQQDGVLILSRFAGASRQMDGAVIINPYDIDKTSDAIKFALEMPLTEQRRRIIRMREEIMSNNIYGWAAQLLRSITNAG